MALRAIRQFAVGGLYGWMSIPPRNTGKALGRALGGSNAGRLSRWMKVEDVPELSWDGFFLR